MKGLHHISRYWLGAILICSLMLGVHQCFAHNERIHEQLSESAFASSDGLSRFLLDILGTDFATKSLFTRPQDGPGVQRRLAAGQDGWLAYGSFMEDMQDPAFLGQHFLRSSDHFYTISMNPDNRMLTDATESPLNLGIPLGLTDSFRWATMPGGAGPNKGGLFTGPNNDTWPNARDYQYRALTNSSKADRDANLALMLYALGHVLHLNQDLSQPEHVRNDAHVPSRFGGHHAIEDYGVKLLESISHGTPRNQIFPPRPRGWLSWRDGGFRKLEDFWDRHIFTGMNPSALTNDATPGGTQLGLAEFTSGNFLGENATYGELIQVGTAEFALHHFFFPSLWTSTRFRAVGSLGATAGTVTFRNGLPGKRLFIFKHAEGVTVASHSVLTYSGRKWVPFTRTIPALRKMISINDEHKVLPEYHSILIPKAIEYSAGILDYFFRGRLEVACTAKDAQAQVTFCVINKSGQALSSSGGFELYGDDAGGDRSLVMDWPNPGLGIDGDITFSFTEPSPAPVKYVLLYKGTIGVDSSNQPLDSVDQDIAIASVTFTVPEAQNPPVVACGPPNEKRVAAMRRWHGADPFMTSVSAPSLPPVRYLTATGRATWNKSVGENTSSATAERTASANGKSGRISRTGTDNVSGEYQEWCLNGFPNDPARPGAKALACALSQASANWIDNLIEVEYPSTWQNGTPPSDHQGPPRETITGTYPNLTKTVDYFVVEMGVTQYHRFYEMTSSGTPGQYYQYEATFYAWGNSGGQWSQSVARHQFARVAATTSYIDGSDAEGNSWSGNGSLCGRNTWDDLNQDLDQMLATWDMTDDELFPWTSCCGDAVLLTRREGCRAVPFVYNEAGNYANAPVYISGFERASFDEGEIIGLPDRGPGPYLDPDRQYPSPFPHAIQWLSGWAELRTEPGGLVRYEPGFWSDTLLKVKWAIQKNDHPPYGGGNPTGDFVFVSGTGEPLTAVQKQAWSTPCSYGVMAVSPNGEAFPTGQTSLLISPAPRRYLVWFALCYSTMRDPQGNYVEARAQQPPGFNFTWPVPLWNTCLQNNPYYPPQ